MLEFILIGLGVLGFTFWYNYKKYMSRRRYIVNSNIIDRISEHTNLDNRYIPISSPINYNSSSLLNGNETPPPKYEDINLYN